MKYLLSFTLLLGSMILLAQPVLEFTYSHSTTMCHLENLGEIYYSMDVVNKQCNIYDMNHSLLKSIAIPIPSGYYLADIQYVSENLFNSDKQVELVYIYSKYVPTETSYYYTFESKLINENGTVLLTLPGVGFTQVIETSGQHMKFLAYEYNYSVIPYRTNTHVYSLPDQSTKSASEYINPVGLGNAYPNPASQQVYIPFTMPEGILSGTLVLSDLEGMPVLNYPLSPGSDHVLLPTGSFTPGTYIYYLETELGRSEGKKIVIR